MSENEERFEPLGPTRDDVKGELTKAMAGRDAPGSRVRRLADGQPPVRLSDEEIIARATGDWG